MTQFINDGFMTEEERATADVQAEPREYDPETFAALLDYLASKDGPTQNAEGVHVGDLFYASWSDGTVYKVQE